MAVVLAEPHHSYNSSLGLSPDPNSIIWMPSPSEHVPRYDIPGVNLPHLSPGSTYQVNITAIHSHSKKYFNLY